jgi:hypothetical protein
MKNAQLKKPSTVLAILLIGLASTMIMLKNKAVHAATTITITTTSDNGAGSLRKAMADAGSGDTINFDLPPQSKIVLTSGEPMINNSITIDGPGANLLVISGNNNSRIFSISSYTSAAISGLTITTLLIPVGARNL